MTKTKELRDMADEQIRLVWKDAAETLFRLRIQSQTEKLAAPTEMKKFRRTIARCQTILAQRGVLAPAASEAAAATAADDLSLSSLEDKRSIKTSKPNNNFHRSGSRMRPIIMYEDDDLTLLSPQLARVLAYNCPNFPDPSVFHQREKSE